MATQNILTEDQIKEIIWRELPGLIERDPKVKEFVLSVTKTIYADRDETSQRFDQILKELREDRERRSKEWDAAVKRWEENDKKWAEQAKRWEENDKRWAEQLKLWEENNKRWAQNDRRWRENQEDIRRLWTRIDIGLGAIGARWGMRAEGSFREALKGILEQLFHVRVERYIEKDLEGKVFGRPDQVELDIIIRDGVLILCEIKSSMSKSDMYAFIRKARFYEERKGQKAQRLLAISPMVEDKAKAVALAEGVEVYSYPDDIANL